MVVEDDCIYFCSDVYILKSSKYIEDGKILSYEETSVGEDIPDKYLKFYKGELYQTYYIYAPFMWKKYEAVPITDISGKYEVYIDSEDDCSYEMNLENSKGKMSSVISAEEKINEDEIDVEILINDGIYTFICGEDTKEFTYGVCFNECFYFHSESGTMVLKNTQAERTNQNEAS